MKYLNENNIITLKDINKQPVCAFFVYMIVDHPFNQSKSSLVPTVYKLYSTEQE